MPDMIVHVADATQVARIVAKILAAAEFSRTLTAPQVARLPDAANEAIALLQEAAAAIEALGAVTETGQDSADGSGRL